MTSKRFLKNQNIVYVDQALISGLNFITAIALTRYLGVEQFGIYTILFICILLITTVHYAVFAAPMMSYAPKIQDNNQRQSYYSSIHSAQIIACIILAISICLFGYVSATLADISNITNYLLPITFCVLLIPPQEWFRRYIFTNNLPSSALTLDLIRTTVQLGSIFILIYLNKLNIEYTLYCIAFASLIPYLIGLYIYELPFKYNGLRNDLIQNWQHGRHLLPTYLLDWIRLQGFLIIGGILIGAHAVGAVRAAQNIVGPLNVFYQAMDNILPIEGAKRLANQGYDNMAYYFKLVGKRYLLVLSILCITIAISSKWIMGFLYGESLEDYSTLVIWQLLSLVLLFSYRICASFLRTINVTQPLMMSTMVSLAALSLLIVPFSLTWEEDGLMLSKIAAEIIALLFLGYSIIHRHRVAP